MALPAKKQFQFWGIGALGFVLLLWLLVLLLALRVLQVKRLRFQSSTVSLPSFPFAELEGTHTGKLKGYQFKNPSIMVRPFSTLESGRWYSSMPILAMKI